jgi:hypothetical protein
MFGAFDELKIIMMCEDSCHESVMDDQFGLLPVLARLRGTAGKTRRCPT